MTEAIRSLGEDRGDFVYRAVERPVERVLDIGCAFGWTLGALTEKADHLVGVDMNEASLRKARASYPHVEFIHQSGASLPCKANAFDVVILSEVIEHVGEENKQSVIDEAHRVLKTGGLFILTAPYAGLFAWMDPMDFKRRFPGIYRLYMRLSGYAPKTPVEVGHKHVSLAEIRRLFGERFEIERVRYCGLFMPLLSWILAVDQRLGVLPERWHQAVNRFRGWESGIAYPAPLAFNLRMTARKRPERKLSVQADAA